MKIKNYGSNLSNKITLRLSDDEKQFISDMSKKYNVTDSQYLRIILDWFMIHEHELSDKV